jgi:hypothetical protein
MAPNGITFIPYFMNMNKLSQMVKGEIGWMDGWMDGTHTRTQNTYFIHLLFPLGKENRLETVSKVTNNHLVF